MTTDGWYRRDLEVAGRLREETDSAVDVLSRKRRLRVTFAQHERDQGHNYRDRELFELIQNGVDAAAGETEARVTLALYGQRLYAANTGAVLTADGVTGLLNLRQPTKRDAALIGKYGVGFKALARVSDRVLFASRSLAFEFSRERSEAEFSERLGPPTGVRDAMMLCGWEVEDVAALLEEDPKLKELASWATTIVRVDLRDEATAEATRQALDTLDARFPLVAPRSTTLTVATASRHDTTSATFSDEQACLRRHDHTTGNCAESQWRVHFWDAEPPDSMDESDGGESWRKGEVIRLHWAWRADMTAPSLLTVVFDTDTPAPVPGLLNAPWMTGTDRRSVVDSPFNRWLAEAFATRLAEAFEAVAREDARRLRDAPAGEAKPPLLIDSLMSGLSAARVGIAEHLRTRLLEALKEREVAITLAGQAVRPGAARVPPSALRQAAPVTDAWLALERLAPDGPTWLHEALWDASDAYLAAGTENGEFPFRPMSPFDAESARAALTFAVRAKAREASDAGGGWFWSARFWTLILAGDGRASTPTEIRVCDSASGYAGFAGTSQLVHPCLGDRLDDLKAVGVKQFSAQDVARLAAESYAERAAAGDWAAVHAWLQESKFDRSVITKLQAEADVELQVRTRAGTWRPLLDVFEASSPLYERVFGDIAAEAVPPDLVFDAEESPLRDTLEKLAPSTLEVVEVEPEPPRAERIKRHYTHACKRAWNAADSKRRGSGPPPFKGPYIEGQGDDRVELRVRETDAQYSPKPDYESACCEEQDTRPSLRRALDRLGPSAAAALLALVEPRLATSADADGEQGMQLRGRVWSSKVSAQGYQFPETPFRSSLAIALRSASARVGDERVPISQLPGAWPERWRALAPELPYTPTQYAEIFDGATGPAPAQWPVDVWRQLLLSAERDGVNPDHRLAFYRDLVLHGPPPPATELPRLLLNCGATALGDVIVTDDVRRAQLDEVVPVLQLGSAADVALAVARGFQRAEDRITREVVPGETLACDFMEVDGNAAIAAVDAGIEIVRVVSLHAVYVCDGTEVSRRSLTTHFDEDRSLLCVCGDDDAALSKGVRDALKTARGIVVAGDPTPTAERRALHEARVSGDQGRIVVALLRSAGEGDVRAWLLDQLGLTGAAATLDEFDLARVAVDTLGHELIDAVWSRSGEGRTGKAPRAFSEEAGLDTELGSDRARVAPAEDVRPFRKLPELRDYQKEVAVSIEESLAARLPLMVTLPTGAGKTRVAVEALVRHLSVTRDPGLVIWVAHTEELCEQALEAWRDGWANFGDLDPSGQPLGERRSLRLVRGWGPNASKRLEGEVGDVRQPTVIVTTAATLSRVAARACVPRQLQALVIDEAHRAVAGTYEDVWNWASTRERRVGVIGLSATPRRGVNAADGSPSQRSAEETARLMRRFVGRIAPSPGHVSVDALQDLEILSRIEFDEPIRSGAKLVDDWESHIFGNLWEIPEAGLTRLARSAERNSAIVERVVSLRTEQRTLVFACNVAHARQLAAQITLAGHEVGVSLRFAAITGETARGRRRALIERFRQGDLHGLVNVEVLTTGFDAPEVNTIVVARPTLSEVLYMQMVGRGLRGPKSGGTAVCRVINVEDVASFGVELKYDDYLRAWESWGRDEASGVADDCADG